MSVRAKFKVQRTESSEQGKYATDADGKSVVTQREMRTIVFAPVYANGDPAHENSKFWDMTPSGEIRLGTINPEAWEQFRLGAEYYVDFTPATPAETKPQ